VVAHPAALLARLAARRRRRHLHRHHGRRAGERLDRLERATIRESKRWHWQRLTGLFAEAGFSDLATVADQEWSSGAMPAGLHVATR
jgi:hypothetical protein